MNIPCSIAQSWLCETPWSAAHQASLSLTISRSLLKFMSIALVMPSKYLILCCLLLFCLQSFPASGSFPMSRLFTSDDQNIGASASTLVLPMNIQGWFPLKVTGLITLLSRGFLGVFSSTTVQRHQFFGTLLSFGIFHTNTIFEVLSPKRGI